MTLSEWIAQHYRKVEREKIAQKGNYLRLGQRFWNDFLKTDEEMDEFNLFYETDDNLSIWFIETWLQDKHYFDHLPARIKR